MREPIVVVGGGVAGASAAAALRDRGYDGRLTVLGCEAVPAYERPVLSKEYLRGEANPTPFRAPEYWAEQQIDLRLGEIVVAVDLRERRVRLASGDELGYASLLLATGARARELRVPGCELAGVVRLRELVDADRLRRLAAEADRVVVVGMGFIGAEVAASLRALGREVALVEPNPQPIDSTFGSEAAAAVLSAHAGHGVVLHLGCGVSGFLGDRRVEAVVVDGTTRLEADLVVVGVGSVARDELARPAGLSGGGGIPVDEYGRTRAADVWAVGDVASYFETRLGRRLRIEHWRDAAAHGALVGRTILGAREPFRPRRWFWSDQYDLKLQYAGFHLPGDEEVIRRYDDNRSIVFYRRDGRITAIAGVNAGRDFRRALPLVDEQAAIDAAVLADETADLGEQVTAHVSAETGRPPST